MLIQLKEKAEKEEGKDIESIKFMRRLFISR
jgi:hypothetical protein